MAIHKVRPDRARRAATADQSCFEDEKREGKSCRQMSAEARQLQIKRKEEARERETRCTVLRSQQFRAHLSAWYPCAARTRLASICTGTKGKHERRTKHA